MLIHIRDPTVFVRVTFFNMSFENSFLQKYMYLGTLQGPP